MAKEVMFYFAYSNFDMDNQPKQHSYNLKKNQEALIDMCQWIKLAPQGSDKLSSLFNYYYYF